MVETGWGTVLMEAKAANIPLVLTDRAIDSTDGSSYVTFMGSDFIEEEHKAGRWLVEIMKDNMGDMNIVELQGAVGSAPAIDGKKGFEEIIETDPRFKIIRSRTGDFTRAKGEEVMEAFPRVDGNTINMLYAANDNDNDNDNMATGAIQALEETGLNPARNISIISIDGVKGPFDVTMEAELNVSVECSPLLGPQLMSAVKNVKASKTLAKRIVAVETIFPMEAVVQEFLTRKY